MELEQTASYSYKISTWDDKNKRFQEEELTSFQAFIKMLKIYNENKNFMNIKTYIITHTAVRININLEQL